jgi:hypothetical protein
MQFRQSMRRTEMTKSIKRLLVAATAILAFSAPSAAFGSDAADGGDSASGSARAPVIAPVSRATESSSPGFQWGDAGVGAAGVVVLVAAGAGGAAVMRQRRAHRTIAG